MKAVTAETMAATKSCVQSLTEEVICSVCLDIFKDPVTVDCGHNFCRDCITEFWRTTSNNLCPKCREMVLLKELRPNTDLKNLVDIISKVIPEHKVDEELFCEKHEEKQKLFCESDQTPLCIVCEKSREHRNHSVIPFEEAIAEKKDKLKASVKHLQKHLETIHKTKIAEEKINAEIKATVEDERKRINMEFAQMHEFLNKENEILLAQLEEEEKKSLQAVYDKMQTLSEQEMSLSALIADIESQLKLQDASFLKISKSAISRCEEPLPKVPPASSGFNSDMFHFPLQYFAWKKMLRIIEPSLALLTLDADTVNNLLILSSDLSVLKWADTVQNFPDSFKRFDGYWTCALSSLGFTSGNHYWEVQLEGYNCIVGITVESSRRDCINSSPPNPEYWIQSGLNLRKIGVYLNYERGQVSFYNAENAAHLNSYHECFSEKVFPFFWVPDKSTVIKLFHLQL